MVFTVNRTEPSQPVPGDEIVVTCEYQSRNDYDNPAWADPRGFYIRTIEEVKWYSL